jgi:hypothetical protein
MVERDAGQAEENDNRQADQRKIGMHPS